VRALNNRYVALYPKQLIDVQACLGLGRSHGTAYTIYCYITIQGDSATSDSVLRRRHDTPYDASSTGSSMPSVMASVVTLVVLLLTAVLFYRGQVCVAVALRHLLFVASCLEADLRSYIHYTYTLRSCANLALLVLLLYLSTANTDRSV
jgi:hypothetical protein